MKIDDGTGAGNQAKVDGNNKLHTFSVVESEAEAAVDKGEHFNINTGSVALTGSTESALFYILNNGSQVMVIDQFVLAVGAGTFADSVAFTVVRDPTGGDVISDATAVDIESNSNFGSSKVLSVDAYKGKDGGTITGGTDHALIWQAGQGRTIVPITMELPQGSSLGVHVDPNLSSGGTTAYCALICHLKDADV